MTGWKPIASAPEDKPILLFARVLDHTYDANEGMKVVIGEKTNDGWRTVPVNSGDAVGLMPTHRAPIPEPFPSDL